MNSQPEVYSPITEKRWYAKIFESVKNYSASNPVFFLFLLLMLPITIFAIQSTLSLLSKATSTDNVNIAFSPATISLPGNKTVKIMMEQQSASNSSSIGFARVVFNFDKTKIKLTTEITSNPLLATIIEKTTMAQANLNGEAKVIIAAPPGGQLPVGNFEFASFSLDSLNDNIGATQINLNTADIQIVNQAQFVLTPVVTNLFINGPAETTPPTSAITPTITVTPSLTPPITPIVTQNLSPSPASFTPAPTVTYAPSATPFVSNPLACQIITSPLCFAQWVKEFSGVLTTKVADLYVDSKIDLQDFEKIRKARFP